jgi:hypothetical protein
MGSAYLAAVAVSLGFNVNVMKIGEVAHLANGEGT